MDRPRYLAAGIRKVAAASSGSLGSVGPSPWIGDPITDASSGRADPVTLCCTVVLSPLSICRMVNHGFRAGEPMLAVNPAHEVPGIPAPDSFVVPVQASSRNFTGYSSREVVASRQAG